MRKYLVMCGCALSLAGNLGPFAWQVMDYDDSGTMSIAGKALPVFPIIQQLYQAQHKNVVFVSDIRGALSMDLHAVSPSIALQTVLAGSGYCAVSMPSADWVGDCKRVAHLQQNKPPEVRQDYTVTLQHTTLYRFLQRLSRSHPSLVKQIVQRDERHNRFTILATSAERSLVETEQVLYDRAKASIRITAYIVSIDDDYLRDVGVEISPTLSHYEGRGFDIHRWLARIPPGITDIGLALHAVEKSGRGTILSSPQLVTVDGQKAIIEAGHDIPYQERGEDGKSALVFKKAVLSLQVLPTVQAPGRIHLHIVIQQDQPGKAYTDSIAIQTRKIATDAEVLSTKTLILGGIVEQNTHHIDAGIPIIDDIPWLGTLFRSQEKLTNKRQLYIFISPEIID